MSGTYPPQGPQGPQYNGPQGPQYNEPQNPQYNSPQVPPPPGGFQGQPNQFAGGYQQPGQQFPGSAPSANAPFESYPGATAGSPGYPTSAMSAPYATQMTMPLTTPPKKSPLVPIIGGGVALAVVLAIVIGVFVVRSNSGPTSSANKVVQAYFDALIAHDAEKALSYAATAPEDKTYLTNDMLIESSQDGGITSFEMLNAGKSAVSVTVTYTMNGEPQFASIPVTNNDGKWSVSTVASKVDLTELGFKPEIGGVKATSDVVYLFPGTYSLATGNDYLVFPSSRDTIEVSDPSRSVNLATYGMLMDVSTEGEELVKAEAKKALAACIAQKKLAPEGCPFVTNPDTTTKTPNLSTLTFTGYDDDFDNISVRQGEGLTLKFIYFPSFTYRVTATDNSGSWNHPVRSTTLKYGTLDLSGETPKFSWTTS